MLFIICFQFLIITSILGLFLYKKYIYFKYEMEDKLKRLETPKDLIKRLEKVEGDVSALKAKVFMKLGGGH